MLKVSKPNSSVDFDVPGILIKEYPYQYAQPASIIFNKIIQSATWPRQWVKETVITISKLKVGQPKNEDDLRTISKTAWLSKLFENILGDYLLPLVDQYIDPGQCGGLKKSSISHYLIRLLDFIQSTLDKRTPHAAVIATEDLSKAYNRGSHNLVMEDLHAMHVPGWILTILCSYLRERSMVLTYQNTASSQYSRYLDGCS